MICIGNSISDKISVLNDYLGKNSIHKIYVFSPDKIRTDLQIDAEYISYKNIIEYEYFYRLLQEIDQYSLLVIDECLRTQNRNDLTYNCLRHYINQAGHIIIFQYLPMISDINDFMILFDFDTKSQWKREKFNKELIQQSCININKIELSFTHINIETPQHLVVKYEKEKSKLFASIGLKDPDTIPRNLYLITGVEKVKYVNDDCLYVARNNRFKFSNIRTYRDDIKPDSYIIFEFPHNFIDFTDFLYSSRQSSFPMMCTNIKVDQWYTDRYHNWLKNLNDVYSKIQ